MQPDRRWRRARAWRVASREWNVLATPAARVLGAAGSALAHAGQGSLCMYVCVYRYHSSSHTGTSACRVGGAARSVLRAGTYVSHTDTSAGSAQPDRRAPAGTVASRAVFNFIATPWAGRAAPRSGVQVLRARGPPRASAPPGPRLGALAAHGRLPPAPTHARAALQHCETFWPFPFLGSSPSSQKNQVLHREH